MSTVAQIFARILKERAYLLEGKVDIWSEPGKGVKIRVEVPDSLDA